MSLLPDAPAAEAATFTVLDGTGSDGEPFAVQFNPTSLEYTVSNAFDDRNGNNGARQFVKKSSAKLSMALIFDTTDDGSDVRGQTGRLARLMEPAKDGSKPFAPRVEFSWGSYRFKGVIEQYKETIDFFAASGVPLRASINLTLSAQEVEFQSNKNPNASVDGHLAFGPVDSAPGAAPRDVANALGDPRAARAIANANGSASLRFGAGTSLSVGGAIAIGAPAAFSAGAGLAGMSTGAAAGSAFAGLRVAATSGASSLNAATARGLLLPAAGASAAVAFGPGGRVTGVSRSGGASLSADVGTGADLHARIGFGG